MVTAGRRACRPRSRAPTASVRAPASGARLRRPLRAPRCGRPATGWSPSPARSAGPGRSASSTPAPGGPPTPTCAGSRSSRAPPSDGATSSGSPAAAGPGHGPDVVHFGYRVAGRAAGSGPLFRAAPPNLPGPARPPRPAGRASGAAPGAPATLGANPTAPGREFTRPQFHRCAPLAAHQSGRTDHKTEEEGAVACGCRDHEAVAGGRSPLRPPDPALEPEDEAVHLRGAQRHLHHRPAADPGADREGVPLHPRPGLRGRHDHVHRDEEAGPGADRRGRRPVRACPT